jgi:hypothetical protein
MQIELIRETESGEVVLDVEVKYSYDPGCRMTGNGDGWPPSEDIDVISVKVGGKVVDNDLTESELETLMEKAGEEHRDRQSDYDDSDDDPDDDD